MSPKYELKDEVAAHTERILSDLCASRNTFFKNVVKLNVNYDEACIAMHAAEDEAVSWSKENS